MIDPKAFHELLKRLDINFYTGVPDSAMKSWCSYVAGLPLSEHSTAAHEGLAVSMAAGRAIAANERTLVYLQNAGLGNAVSPLASLVQVHELPMMLLIGFRGEPNYKDEPQHEYMGAATRTILQALKIPFLELKAMMDINEVELRLTSMTHANYKSTFAVLCSRGLFSKEKQDPWKSPKIKGTGVDSVAQMLVDLAPADSIFVGATGHISRALWQHLTRQGRQAAFYNIGAMGHTAAIAWGMRSVADRPIVVLDGDGAAAMHMGQFLTIGAQASSLSSPFYHIILNNGVYMSVGGQPLGFDTDAFLGIARASGYKHVQAISSKAWRFDVAYRHLVEYFEHEQTPSLLLFPAGPSWGVLERPDNKPSDRIRMLQMELGVMSPYEHRRLYEGQW